MSFPSRGYPKWTRDCGIGYSAFQSKLFPLRDKAHRAIAKAIRLGLMPKASTLVCVDCGTQASDYDHRDYTKPLDVEPVCRSCNVRRGSAAPYQR